MKKDGKSLEKEMKTGARLTHWKEMLTAGVSLERSTDGQQRGSTVWVREKHHHPSPKHTLLCR